MHCQEFDCLLEGGHQRLRVEIDGIPEPAASTPQTVNAALQDGTALRHAIDTMMASPQRPPATRG